MSMLNRDIVKVTDTFMDKFIDTDTDTDMDKDMDLRRPRMTASWISGVPLMIIC
jgi:hypothetical protein